MKLKYLKNVSTLRYIADKCVGCGRCVQVCPHSVFLIDESDANKAKITDKDSCMECGACSRNCPADAIQVNAGVGCALAIIMSWFTGREPSCGCGDGSCC